MKSIVVAYEKNRGIGKDNDLPWGRRLKSDLVRFRALTIGKSVIMGRKTFESIGFALPGRENIVVSHQDLELPGTVLQAHSIDEAYALASNDIYVIGGATLYEQTLLDVDVIYATEVDAEIEGVDTLFPVLEADTWRETSRIRQEPDEDNAYGFDFVTYQRNL